MIRRNILAVLLLLIMGVLIFGVMYLNNPDIFAPPPKKSIESNTPVTLIVFPVREGEITHTYEVNGEVISGVPELYINEIFINNVTDKNFVLHKSKGEYFEPQDVIYEYKGKEKTVDFSGFVVGIEFLKNDNTKTADIKLLNFDKLYIVSSIDASKINQISYATEVILNVDGKDYYSSINDIGYEFADNKLPINIDLPINLLPGTKVKVTYILDTINHGLYVPEEAVFLDGKDYYANLQVNNGLQKVKIVVGQHFSVEEDGVEFKYLEILSGVNEGDNLVVEKVDNAGLEIKENLINE